MRIYEQTQTLTLLTDSYKSLSVTGVLPIHSTHARGCNLQRVCAHAVRVCLGARCCVSLAHARPLSALLHSRVYGTTLPDRVCVAVHSSLVTRHSAYVRCVHDCTTVSHAKN